MLVCNVIAPNDGKTLFHALSSPGGEKDETAEADDVLKSLMTAYKNAKIKSMKTQILSLYAYKYSVSTLKELHSPYGKLSTRQIQRARCHARTIGPGQVPRYIIFYQDVSYGTKFLKLDSGETIEMPNVVHTVTRSTMISLYIQFCRSRRSLNLSVAPLYSKS